MLNSSSEVVVVTEQGLAIKTRSANIRRVPESERDGTLTAYSKCGPLLGHQMAVTVRSTSKLEWRDPLRWCPFAGQTSKVVLGAGV